MQCQPEEQPSGPSQPLPQPSQSLLGQPLAPVPEEGAECLKCNTFAELQERLDCIDGSEEVMRAFCPSFVVVIKRKSFCWCGGIYDRLFDKLFEWKKKKGGFVWMCLICFQMYSCHSGCLQWHFPAPFNKHMSLCQLCDKAHWKNASLCYCRNNCMGSHYFHVSNAGFHVARSSCDLVYSHPAKTEGAISGELFSPSTIKSKCLRYFHMNNGDFLFFIHLSFPFVQVAKFPFEEVPASKQGAKQEPCPSGAPASAPSAPGSAPVLETDTKTGSIIKIFFYSVICGQKLSF